MKLLKGDHQPFTAAFRKHFRTWLQYSTFINYLSTKRCFHFGKWSSSIRLPAAKIFDERWLGCFVNWWCLAQICRAWVKNRVSNESTETYRVSQSTRPSILIHLSFIPYDTVWKKSNFSIEHLGFWISDISRFLLDFKLLESWRDRTKTSLWYALWYRGRLNLGLLEAYPSIGLIFENRVFVARKDARISGVSR